MLNLVGVVAIGVGLPAGLRIATSRVPMRIKFVNHASFLLEAAGVTLLCDPWTRSKAFNDGWALLSPSAEVPYDRVDYIWISHEHPDHFNFPTLRSIPENCRSRITVLYQAHSSPRLVEAFRKLGFKEVVELPLYRWTKLRDDFSVLCGSVGSMDSFLAVRSEGECVLNLNDCVCTVAQTNYIQRLVGKVSLLFTQFSFANWIGNHADQIGAVREKQQDLALRVKTFAPEFTVPFASFIYFCNQENSWMNDLMITPEAVAAMGLPGVNFMYPGDEWDSQSRAFHSDEAVAAYMRDIRNAQIDPTPPSVPPEQVRSAIVQMLDLLRKRFGKLIVGKIQPFSIYAHDIGQIFLVYPKEGSCFIRQADAASAEQARYVMCSQAAWYAFHFTWGWGTLEVSAMYLDQKFETQGSDKRLRFFLNAFSTDYLNWSDAARIRRTTRFLWQKKFELFYRFQPRWAAGAHSANPNRAVAADARKQA